MGKEILKEELALARQLIGNFLTVFVLAAIYTLLSPSKSLLGISFAIMAGTFGIAAISLFLIWSYYKKELE